MRWMHAAGRALLVVAVVLAGYTGLGVRPDVGTASDARGPLTLVTAGDLTDYLGPLLDDWNASRPEERVTLVELPDSADETRAQMISELRSGRDRFDVLNIDVAWTSEFAAAGWISPLERDRFPLDAFLRPVVDTATFDGRLYAVPYVTNAGLLYYRKDILDEAGEQPPRTWSELARQARTIAPRYGLDGYAGQFLPYEGLTVNVTEAVHSAGGSILRDDGARVTVDSAGARAGLRFLADGVREGWISRDALGYKEEESRKAFQDGRLLFLRNWPYVYADASAQGSKVAGRFGAVPLPGADGPGTSVLGGSNLAVSSHARHPASAADLISYLTSERVQRRVLTEGSLPPVRAALYEDPELVRAYPYLPTLRESVLSAVPRPKSPRYDQVSLAVQAVGQDVMALRQTPDEAVARLARELGAISRTG
ncbi:MULTISPECIES: ABC transporter substrate-binding protein [Streptomyces]|uniref:ABC transporter substrate-binding protein n=1 Tax=Streptomyces TaxID=1883 RepID=UPI0004BD9A69|nr:MULTISPECIES: ABC transporter substrate-binding protein [Streptomyces]KOU12811.1 ABC transporter substrate-binding protein [Streptomyces sp. WM6349]KOU91001.1 ABC transporter substrate-binding protein [Streptomyces sp. XY533]KOV40396.1 ABC transporter substrate-binding protein [Streptomyces sp. H036]MCI4079304.1 ABC transporter substrate-binding protein [Streptomyces sp. MMS21 TC-5]QNE29445.1 ABC transporter substrate-binding protein [Streptomyces sp. INR7]